MKKHQRFNGERSPLFCIACGVAVYLLLFPALCLVAAIIRYNGNDPTALASLISLAIFLTTGALGSIFNARILRGKTVAANLCSAFISVFIYIAAALISTQRISAVNLMNSLCFIMIVLLLTAISRSASAGKARRRRKGNAHR